MNVVHSNAPLVRSTQGENVLTQVEALVDWSMLSDGIDALARDAKRGLPLGVVKLQLLRRWYNLDNVSEVALLLDRVSVRAFVGLDADDDDQVSDLEAAIDDGYWFHATSLGRIVDAIEDQLRVQGYAVRAGKMTDPSLMPRTDAGAKQGTTSETHVYQPGELGRLVEAVTQKAHSLGLGPITGPQASQDAPPAAVSVEQANSATDANEARAPVSQRLRAAPPISSGEKARAVLDWPWGQRSELSEHLNIGRDHEFSPLARELTPYTHVSRRHAELLVYGDGVWVRDLGSRNGTFVNEDEVPKGQAFLIDSDSIVRFGPLLAVSLKILG
jgi:hypothetical protein